MNLSNKEFIEHVQTAIRLLSKEAINWNEVEKRCAERNIDFNIF